MPEADAREHLHVKCDCVPSLGPAHCHLCSDLHGAPVAWPQCDAVREAITESLAEVTRVTVVTGVKRVFEGWDLYQHGVDLVLQDQGRTLKLLPAPDPNGDAV